MRRDKFSEFHREHAAEGCNSQTTPMPLEEQRSGLNRGLVHFRDWLGSSQGAVSEEARGSTERGGGAFAAQGRDTEAEATGADVLDVLVFPCFARHVPVMTLQLSVYPRASPHL